MLKLPRQLLLHQRLASHPLVDPAAEVRAGLATLDDDDWAGRSVAVALGSRGIDRIALIGRTVVGWLRERGAEPFVLPAMGSHGGGTPEGQIDLLASYGITEASIGAPIRAGMETRELGVTPFGFPVRTSAVALDADGVILVNRVKPHTDFAGVTLGSGLLKMCGIGLGKADGAFACHLAASRHGHEAVIRAVARIAIAKLPRLYGVALVEDGTHRLARTAVLRGEAFEDQERPLYEQAREWMPKLPLAEIDVLVVDEIGKDISGTGMDTNITGRGVDLTPMANRHANVRAIYARGLTEASHGNAIGIGLADVVSSRLVAQMDPVITYTNALSAMTSAPPRISINFPTDAACVRAALRIAGVEPEVARILRIRNTLALDRIVASEACHEVIAAGGAIAPVDVAVDATEWRFDAEGNFDPATDLIALDRERGGAVVGQAAPVHDLEVSPPSRRW